MPFYSKNALLSCIYQNFCVPLQAKFQTMDHDKWQWQEPGTAWRGVGLYHITLTVTSRQPLLGTLVIPNNDPAQARVDVSPFGRTLTNLLWDISKYQPDIQMLHYALMPDHLHFIWYVKRPLARSIREVVSGFWVGAKKLGRAYSYNDSSFVRLCPVVVGITIKNLSAIKSATMLIMPSIPSLPKCRISNPWGITLNSPPLSTTST